MAEKFRIWSNVTPELYEELSKWATRLGLTKAQLVNICVQAGLGSVIRAIAPEESIPPVILAEIIKSLEEKGVPIDGLKEIQDEKTV